MSLFESIGGEVAVGQAVERFYARLKADPVIGGFFDSSDVERLTSHQEMFLTAALGGPDTYEGRDMRAAHAHLPITDTDFELFLEHLGETLADLGAEPAQIAEVTEALAPLRSEIVSAPGDGPDEWGSIDPSGGSG